MKHKKRYKWIEYHIEQPVFNVDLQNLTANSW